MMDVRDTVIIGVSGKKQSGKSSLCSYLQSWFGYNESESDLKWLSFSQDEFGNGIFKTSTGKIVPTPSSITDKCKIYNFADALKELVCQRVLGLTEKQTHGSDEDKNTPTRYMWDRMPMSIRYTYSKEKERYAETEPLEFGGQKTVSRERSVPRSGPMTAREIMQITGTEIFRAFYHDEVWVDATFNTISKEKPKLAFIADVRFPSEVEAIVNNGGYIIRLDRRVHDDNHSSETSLDNFPFSTYKNCFVIENSNTSMQSKNDAGVEILKSILHSQSCTH